LQNRCPARYDCASNRRYGSIEGNTMSVPVVDPNACTACGTCIDECPESCYDLEDVAKLNRPGDCTECGICVDSCPDGAISMD
jgi:NAD-dependent dihydropyrimidine dehydrogenase PreA subunit